MTDPAPSTALLTLSDDDLLHRIVGQSGTVEPERLLRALLAELAHLREEHETLRQQNGILDEQLTLETKRANDNAELYGDLEQRQRHSVLWLTQMYPQIRALVEKSEQATSDLARMTQERDALKLELDSAIEAAERRVRDGFPLALSLAKRAEQAEARLAAITAAVTAWEDARASYENAMDGQDGTDVSAAYVALRTAEVQLAALAPSSGDTEAR